MTNEAVGTDPPVSASGGDTTLVQVSDLKLHFPFSTGSILRRRAGAIRAVDGVSFDVKKGETLGLVGESGCGKSTTGRAILRLYRPTEGSVRFDGIELTTLTSEQMRRMRRRMQMIFQDPYASLSPRLTVGAIIGEALEIHGLARGPERVERIEELMQLVGLDPRLRNRFAHEFSGGQRQRIGVARALAVGPEFIVADEPISALDVSIQAQVINLLEDLQGSLGLTFLFIAHDLAVVRHISDRIAVMYLGKIVELADRVELYSRPIHPYTKALLSAVPIPDPIREQRRNRIILKGDIGNPADPPSGCRFRTRCFRRERLGDPEICSTTEPPFIEQAPAHWAACHFPDAVAPTE